MKKQIQNLLIAVEAIIPDLQHYVNMHGPGPDERLKNLQCEITKIKDLQNKRKNPTL